MPGEPIVWQIHEIAQNEETQWVSSFRELQAYNILDCDVFWLTFDGSYN